MEFPGRFSTGRFFCSLSAEASVTFVVQADIGRKAGKIKERPGRKPVSVFKSAIYLRNLPPGIGRAALICRYIWFCRPRWRTRSVSLPCVVSSCLAFSPLTSRKLSETASVRRRLFSVTPCLKLPPPALSAAGCPSLSGLSSAFRPRQIVRPDSL